MRALVCLSLAVLYAAAACRRIPSAFASGRELERSLRHLVQSSLGLLTRDTHNKVLCYNSSALANALDTQGLSCSRVVVVPDTSVAAHSHPVVQVIRTRVLEGSIPGRRSDRHKVALCIEGGGMRGCVSAGMTAALNHLRINDAVDTVYGSSAGAMVAAYFVSRQYSDISIYHDVLPCAGRAFIDKRRIPSSLGLQIPALFGKGAMPDVSVINLSFLLDEVMGRLRPLDWESFEHNDKLQPLKVIASGVRSLKTVSMSSAGGNFSCRQTLLECIRASMLVPGLAGGLMYTSPGHSTPRVIANVGARKGRTCGTWVHIIHKLSVTMPTVSLGDEELPQDAEPLADAFICEPMPYLQAVKDGCTHIIVLRTRPDGVKVLGKPLGFYERFIANRFFRKHGLREVEAHTSAQCHDRIYAESIAHMNEAARGDQLRQVHLLPVACAHGSAEVSQLEINRAKVLQGMRDGCARVFEVFGPAMGLSPHRYAEEVSALFPKRILDTAVDVAVPSHSRGSFIQVPASGF